MTRIVHKLEPDADLAGAQEAARAAADAVRERAGMKTVAAVRAETEQQRKDELVGGRSDADKHVMLHALAACAGNSKRAARRLGEVGIEVEFGELDVMREQHTTLYMTIADEYAKAVEEGIAQGYREILASAQRVTVGYVRQLENDLDSGVMPKDMDRAVQSLAKVLQVSTDKLLAITGRPVNGDTTTDPLESLRTLEKLGIAKRVERPVDVVHEDITEATEVRHGGTD